MEVPSVSAFVSGGTVDNLFVIDEPFLVNDHYSIFLIAVSTHAAPDPFRNSISRKWTGFPFVKNNLSPYRKPL